MIHPDIAFYALFLRDNSKVKRGGKWQERKTPKFILSKVNGYWTGYDHLQTKKGELYLNLISSERNANRKQGSTTPEYYLQCRPSACKSSFNLSGLRLMQNEEEDYWTCAGEPSQAPTLKSGDKNPLIDEAQDGFIFVVDKDFQWLEMWVIAGQRLMIDAYRHAFALHRYDVDLKQIRKTAKDVGV